MKWNIGPMIHLKTQTNINVNIWFKFNLWKMDVCVRQWWLEK